MILQENIEVTLSGSNAKHYLSKGYELPYRKDNKGRLTFPKSSKITVRVIDLPRTSNQKVLVICEDCGVQREIQYGTIVGRKNSKYLETGETLCSNCANLRMSGINSPCYKHGNLLYPQYRNNARRRGIYFKLSVEEFESMIPGFCHYCGYESNGIDRINSDLGYETSNCVSCCSQCNFIKNNTPQAEFVEKIKRMYETFIKNGL